MSGVGPTVGGSLFAAGTAAGAQGLLPMTGIAVSVFVAIGMGLIVLGFALRRIAAARS